MQAAAPLFCLYTVDREKALEYVNLRPVQLGVQIVRTQTWVRGDDQTFGYSFFRDHISWDDCRVR